MSVPVPQTQKVDLGRTASRLLGLGRDEAAQGRPLPSHGPAWMATTIPSGMGGLVFYTESHWSRHRQHRHGRPWSFAWTRASRLLPEPCSHHPSSLSALTDGRGAGNRARGTFCLGRLLAAVVFAWAVGRGCDRRVAGQSPVQPPCKSTDALGGTWTVLFPLPSLPSPVSPFHCPTDLQMTTSRRRDAPLLCALRVCGPLFWRRGDSAAALFWGVGKVKLVMGRRVEQRQKGGKRKTNRRAFHDPSTITTPAAKRQGRKAGPATLSTVNWLSLLAAADAPPPGGGTYAPPCNSGGGSSRHACFCGQDPLTNFPRASPVLAVVGSGPGSVGGLVADSPNPRTHGIPYAVFSIFLPFPTLPSSTSNVSSPVPDTP